LERAIVVKKKRGRKAPGAF